MPDRKSVIADALPSVLMVENLAHPARGNRVGVGICGTAFVADERGYCLTAGHVVRRLKPEKLELRANYSRDGGYAMSPCRSVEAIYSHHELDFAVLAVPPTFTRGRTKVPVAVADVALGDDVLLMGYAEGTQLVFADEILGAGSAKSYSPVALNGMISARIPDDGRPVELLVYDCTTFEGVSGSPVISIAAAAIVGVHLRGHMSHIGYAVPIGRCRKFLDESIAIHEAKRSASRVGRRSFG